MANRVPLVDETGEVRKLKAEDLKYFRPASEMLPEIMGTALTAEMLRPKKTLAKPDRNAATAVNSKEG